MAKLTLSDVSNLTGAESAAIATINANWDAIIAALENTLSRDGTTPNQMGADLDLNSNDILNGGAAAFTSLSIGGVAFSPAALDDITDVTITSVTDGEFLRYDSGSSRWINNTHSEADLLVKSSNLSDIPSASAARTNLGATTVGNAMFTAASEAAGRAAIGITTGAGFGDMQESVYDPTGVAGDAFDMDNMVEGTNTKIMTAAERSKIVTIGLVRDAATATAAAALDDGTVVQIAGLLYEVDSSATGTGSATNDLSVDGLVPYGNSATLRHYGVVGDGTTDDTTNFIRALKGTLPVVELKPMEILITDSVPLKYGACFIGAGGVAVYAKSRCRIKFQPATAKKLFVWDTTPIGYVSEGCTLKGFCVTGNGSNSTYCLDLPQCYNGDFDFYAYGSVQRWVRIERWLNCKLYGGVQGFSVCGVEGSNTLGTGAGVSTTVDINAYISQGPIAYQLYSFAFFGIKVRGTVESVDSVAVADKANSVEFDIYMENTPRTDAGSAFSWGKSGTGDWYYSSLKVNLNPGLGYNGGTPVNTKLLDLGDVRQCVVSGYLANTRSILATTSGTRSVVFNGFSTVSVARLAENASDISDATALNIIGLYSSDLIFPGDGYYSDYSLAGADVELFPADRAAVLRRKLAVDAWTGKLVRRDAYNNLSQPIGYLETTATSGWTFNGAKLMPGELVVHSTSDTGQVALWRSQRHTKDSAVSVASCSTTSGSAVISKSAGAFASFAINDWVTVSAGYASATVQRRIIDIASDTSTITLDSNATSTVSGTVTVATEAHQLVPIAQQGFRQAATAPSGVVTPKFIGEEYFDTAGVNWYKSTGLTNTDWKALT